MPRVYSSGVDITVIRLAGTVYLDWSNLKAVTGGKLRRPEDRFKIFRGTTDGRTYEPIIFPFFRDVETDSLHILGADRMVGQIYD